MISIVVPCFNEQEVLDQTHQELAAAFADQPVEIVYVDDGSRDRTPAILARLQREDSRVRVVTLARNFGHQAALAAGLDVAQGEAVGVIDADLQDPPDVLRAMFDRWHDGNQVVYGVRTQHKERLFKWLTSHGFYRILGALTDTEIPFDAADFCVMDRQVVDTLRSMREQQPYWRGLRAWVGYQQSAFQYERKLRQAGETKYTLRKMISLAGDALVGFSLQPLRLATALGTATTAVALLAAAVVAVVYAAGGSDGPLSESATLVNALLALAILFLGGTQLICLGILGEYVGRIFENVKGRPRYIVREPAVNDATRRRAA